MAHTCPLSGGEPEKYLLALSLPGLTRLGRTSRKWQHRSLMSADWLKAAGTGIALCRALVTVFQRRNAAKEQRQQGGPSY
jgi:hypothetical protein